MRTRRTPIWPDHVGALNLVEIEFHDCPKVITPSGKNFLNTLVARSFLSS